MSEPNDRDRQVLDVLYSDDGAASEFEVMANYRAEIAKNERERVLAAIEDEAYPLLGRTCQRRLAPVIAKLRSGK